MVTLRGVKHAILANAMVLALAGCGFEPMLASRDNQTSSPVAADFSKIKVGYPENRSGQILHNQLVDVLNPRGEPEHPEYSLVIKIVEPQQNLAFQRNNSVTNVSYGIQAYWSLLDSKGVPIYSSGSSSSQQYIISTSQYATGVSAQSARDQVALEITQDIRNKLALFFLSRKAGNAAPSKPNP